MIRLAIIDDHHLFSAGLRKLLENTGSINMIKAFISYSELKNLSSLDQFDIVLLDINLGSENGIEVCGQIKVEKPDIKIIALTMINELSVIRKMINNGVDGYLLKNVDKEELINAIIEVNKGNQYWGSNTSHKIYNRFLQEKVENKTSLPTLSRREKEVLELIIEEYTTQEIAETLHIGFSTVETHRRNLSIKLGARNTAGLVRIALENKLI